MSILAPTESITESITETVTETPGQRRARRIAQSGADDAQRIFFDQGVTAAHEHLAYVETGPAPLAYRSAFAQQMEALLGAFSD